MLVESMVRYGIFASYCFFCFIGGYVGLGMVGDGEEKGIYTFGRETG
jgi:hypothetical protein